MKTAFFDMDRTILSEDSGTSWLRFRYKRGELSAGYMARAACWLVLYRLALLDMNRLAERLVADLKGDLESEMIAKCDQWLQEDLVAKISPEAVAQIRAHQEAGDLVVMITGAIQFASYPIAKVVGIDEVLCSRVEVVDGVFTGRLESMCFGQHKVTLAKEFALRHKLNLSDAVFYTDSFNDMPLLKEVGEGVVVNADARLMRQAKKRGWRVEKWAV